MRFVLEFRRFFPRSAAQVHQRRQTLRPAVPAGVPGVGGGLCRGDGHRAAERGSASPAHRLQRLRGGKREGAGCWGGLVTPRRRCSPRHLSCSPRHPKMVWTSLGAFPAKAMVALLACPQGSPVPGGTSLAPAPNSHLQAGCCGKPGRSRARTVTFAGCRRCWPPRTPGCSVGQQLSEGCNVASVANEVWAGS